MLKLLFFIFLVACQSSPSKNTISSNNSRYIWPLKGSGVGVSSEFGRRRGKMHTGLDIRAPKGSSIRAVANGKVIFVGNLRGYGLTVILHHGSFQTLYAHCLNVLVKKGKKVKRGKKIARVGKSGRASGYHLHFEYRNSKGKARNPRILLSGNP